jgi:hypothetical protein
MKNNLIYSIPDEHMQLAHKIAQFLVKEQQRIEPDKEGISAELSKMITYLNSKIKQRKPARFFTYLEQLIEYGEIIGHSGSTPVYYESIHTICTQHLKLYDKKPLVLIQILGWSQRLMRFYKTVNPNFEPEISQTEQTKSVAVKAPQGLNKPPTVVKPTITETSKTLEPTQKPQPPKPIPPKKIQPENGEDSKVLKRPKLEGSKPFERPPKKS